MQTIREREPLAVIPTYDSDGHLRRFMVVMKSHTTGYVVAEVASMDDTEWNANGWYYETAPTAVRAAALRALHGPLSWEMILSMSRNGCTSR